MLDISILMDYLKEKNYEVYKQMLKLNYIEKVNNNHS